MMVTAQIFSGRRASGADTRSGLRGAPGGGIRPRAVPHLQYKTFFEARGRYGSDEPASRA